MKKEVVDMPCHAMPCRDSSCVLQMSSAVDSPVKDRRMHVPGYPAANPCHLRRHRHRLRMEGWKEAKEEPRRVTDKGINSRLSRRSLSYNYLLRFHPIS